MARDASGFDTPALKQLKPINGIFFPRNIKFNYCILDEGHVIKNGKTKLSKAIKQLAANYRIILSGTPIQVIHV